MGLKTMLPPLKARDPKRSSSVFSYYSYNDISMKKKGKGNFYRYGPLSMNMNSTFAANRIGKVKELADGLSVVITREGTFWSKFRAIMKLLFIFRSLYMIIKQFQSPSEMSINRFRETY